MNTDRFIITSREDMERRGVDQLDIVFISGDAYVDHPSFGIALLARLCEKYGYNVGIIPQPRWDSTEDFLKLGVPRLCCMIGAGNIDSMVAHYTAANRKRSTDYYSPGGKAGLRPDRATITYTGRAKQAYGKDVPIIIGGLEASLRRFAHYDIWSETVRRSILLDSKADILIYGMGELQTLEIASRLDNGEDIKDLIDIRGTTVALPEKRLSEIKYPVVKLPSYEEVSERDRSSNTPTEEGKLNYAKAFNLQLTNENPMDPKVMIQECGGRYVVQNPPAERLDQKFFDSLYELPYTRLAHPMYDKDGGVPGLQEVQFSITSTRGCYGGCSFCAITSHQGRMIQTRSRESLVREATYLASMKEFKGYIHDLGGPTANFQDCACEKQKTKGICSNRQCLFPKPCPNLKDSHERYMDILDAVAAVKGVKKVFIRSGIRYDYLMEVAKPEVRDRFIEHIVKYNISGQLKIAPEHVSREVLDAMGKSPVEVYNSFLESYEKANRKLGMKQYTIPYLIAAHPGSTIDSAIELALYCRKIHFVPDQVQEFYPTPGTVSTCMYYTGLDPRPGRNFAPIYVPKGREKHQQRALLQFNKPENRRTIIELLTENGRKDLIPVLLGGAHEDRRPDFRKRDERRSDSHGNRDGFRAGNRPEKRDFRQRNDRRK